MEWYFFTTMWKHPGVTIVNKRTLKFKINQQNEIGPIMKFAKSQNYVAVAAGSQSAPLCVNIILMDSKLVGMGALIGDITVCM